MKYYKEADGHAIERKRAACLKCMGAVSALLVLLFGISLLFAQWQTATAYKIVGVILLTLAGWQYLFCYHMVYIPLRNRVDVYEICLTATQRLMRAEVVSVGRNMTLNGGIRVEEVTLRLEEEDRKVYFERALGSFPFPVGAQVALFVAGNYITGYEEVPHE